MRLFICVDNELELDADSVVLAYNRNLIINVDTKVCKTVADVRYQILNEIGPIQYDQMDKISLSLNGFMFLPNQAVDCIKENDIIRVSLSRYAMADITSPKATQDEQVGTIEETKKKKKEKKKKDTKKKENRKDEKETAADEATTASDAAATAAAIQAHAVKIHKKRKLESVPNESDLLQRCNNSSEDSKKKKVRAATDNDSTACLATEESNQSQRVLIPNQSQMTTPRAINNLPAWMSNSNSSNSTVPSVLHQLPMSPPMAVQSLSLPLITIGYPSPASNRGNANNNSTSSNNSNRNSNSNSNHKQKQSSSDANTVRCNETTAIAGSIQQQWSSYGPNQFTDSNRKHKNSNVNNSNSSSSNSYSNNNIGSNRRISTNGILANAAIINPSEINPRKRVYEVWSSSESSNDSNSRSSNSSSNPALDQSQNGTFHQLLLISSMSKLQVGDKLAVKFYELNKRTNLPDISSDYCKVSVASITQRSRGGSINLEVEGSGEIEEYEWADIAEARLIATSSYATITTTIVPTDITPENSDNLNNSNNDSLAASTTESNKDMHPEGQGSNSNGHDTHNGENCSDYLLQLFESDLLAKKKQLLADKLEL